MYIKTLRTKHIHQLIYCLTCMISLLFSLVTLLHTDQDVTGSIPGSTSRVFSNGELFHGMYGLSVSVFQCPLPCSVMYCLQWMPQHSTDHKSGYALQLCPCAYMWSRETPVVTVSGIKGKNNQKICMVNILIY